MLLLPLSLSLSSHLSTCTPLQLLHPSIYCLCGAMVKVVVFVTWRSQVQILETTSPHTGIRGMGGWQLIFDPWYLLQPNRVGFWTRLTTGWVGLGRVFSVDRVRFEFKGNSPHTLYRFKLYVIIMFICYDFNFFYYTKRSPLNRSFNLLDIFF